MDDLGIALQGFKKEVSLMDDTQKRDVEYVADKLFNWLEYQGLEDSLSEDQMTDIILDVTGFNY